MSVDDQYRDLLRGAYERTPACLSDADLTSSAANSPGELPENVRIHLDGCPRCKAEISLLRSFEAGEGTLDEQAQAAAVSRIVQRRMPRSAWVPAEKKIGWKQWLTFTTFSRWSLATALLVGIASLSLYRLRSTQENTGLSETGGADVYRSEGVRLIAPRGDIAEVPESFSWNAQPGAVRYEVTVMEVDKTVLWRQTTVQTRISAPSELRAKALPGKTLLWQVVALGPGGKPVAVSETWRVRHMVR